MSTQRKRNHTRVDDSQALNALDPTFGIDNAAHGASPTAVVDRARNLDTSLHDGIVTIVGLDTVVDTVFRETIFRSNRLFEGVACQAHNGKEKLPVTLVRQDVGVTDR